MYVGINHHPPHPLTETSNIERYDVVRYPVWNDLRVGPYQKFTDKMLAIGVRPLIVVDSRSIAGFKTYKDAITRLYRRYRYVEYWQIGNEMDQIGDSSWTMKPDDYLRLLDAALDVLPRSKTIISGGLVSGNVDYARHLKGACFDKLGLHFYGAFPVRKNRKWLGWGFGDVMDGVEAYRNIIDKPVWITEFGLESSAFNSSAERQLYFEDMLVELSDSGVVEAALPYCLTKEQCGELALDGSVRI